MGCTSGKQNPEVASNKSSNQPKAESKKHALLVHDNPGKIQEFYNIDKKKLGEGSYGSVSKCTHKTTKAVRAVKLISKTQRKDLQRFKKEIAIMKVMDHPNILKLHETFEDQRFIYLVLELCTGGELFEHIINSGHFTEKQAAIVMKDLFRAIYYMHSSHFAHRDLKPENFLFLAKEDKFENNTLKVIDFGLACEFTPGQFLKTKAGTPYYVAPQVLAGKYNELADVWSLGVIMFVLLCGYPPFYGDTDADVLAKVRLGSYTFNPKDWKAVSEDAKDLIRNLLKTEPKDRFAANQALNHRWITETAPKASTAAVVDLGQLTNFTQHNKLKKATMQLIPSLLADSQIKKLREAFQILDSNGDGRVSVDEMISGLEQFGVAANKDIDSLVKAMDADGSGEIDYTEFLAATVDKKMMNDEGVLWQAFMRFDLNNDGKITSDELAVVLQEEPDCAAVIAEMQKIDVNNDGGIDFNEFLDYFYKNG